MKQIVVSRQIAAPQENVFQVFTDLEKAPERIKGIVKLELLTPGPVGKGTRFKETRKMMGMTATEEMTVSAFNPPNSYEIGCTSHGTEYLSTWNFLPDGQGTRVELIFAWKPLTMMAKMMGFMGGMMSGTVKKCLEDDLNDLKAYLEDSTR